MPFQTADVVEVQPNTIRGIDVIVNGEVVDFDSLISRTLSFEGIYLYINPYKQRYFSKDRFIMYIKSVVALNFK